MKETILTILAAFLLASTIMPAHAGIVQDMTEKAKEKARELLEISAPERKKTKFENVIDAIAGKYTHLKKCLKGEQACNKSDFLILGTGLIVTYSFIFGLRTALLNDLKASKKDDDLGPKALKLYKFMKFTTNNDPLVALSTVSKNAGEKTFTTIFGIPNAQE